MPWPPTGWKAPSPSWWRPPGSSSRSSLPIQSSYRSWRDLRAFLWTMCLEAPAGLTERLAPAETERRRRCYLEHQRNVAIVAVNVAVAHCEVPVAAILRLVQIRDALEQALVAHSHGVAFHHHVEPLVEGVAACGEDAVRVAREVLRFALALAGAKIQRAIQPDGEQRRDVRVSIWTHRRQPVDLRRLQLRARLRPRSRGRVVAAKLWLQLSHRVSQRHPLAPCGRSFTARRRRAPSVQPQDHRSVSSLEVGGIRQSYPRGPAPLPVGATHPSVSLPVVSRWASHLDQAYMAPRLPGGRCN